MYMSDVRCHYDAIETESTFNIAFNDGDDKWLSACQDDYMNSDWFNQAFKDTKLYETIENQCFKAPVYRRFEVADLLLKQGANANGKIDGMYLIEKAIDANNEDLFTQLYWKGANIPEGANVDLCNNGHTPLYRLVFALVQMLNLQLKEGEEEVYIKEKDKLTLLIKKLIQAGANIHYKDGNGESPYDLVQAHPEAASLLQAGFYAGEAQVSSTYAAVPEANIAASASNDKYATIMPILMFGVGLCIGLSAYYFIGLSALLSVGVALLGFAVVGVVDSLCRPCLSVKGTSSKSAFSFSGRGREREIGFKRSGKHTPFRSGAIQYMHSSQTK